MGNNKHIRSTQESGTKAPKAVWHKKTVHVFCDVCVRAVQKGLRPTTHFSPAGWRYVVEHFRKESGYNYDKTQLKNKWDLMKKEWKTWKDLTGQDTGLRWDPNLQTVYASDSWWTEKIKAMPEASKFRKEGIEPELCSKNDIMFTVTTGKSPLAPALSVVPSDAVGFVDDDPLENFLPFVGNGDSERPDFVDNLDQVVHGAAANLSSATVDLHVTLEKERKYKKQKVFNGSSLLENTDEKFKNEKKQLGGGSKWLPRSNRLVANVESRSSDTSNGTDQPGCSIFEVMRDLQSLPGIEGDKELYYFAAYLIEQRTKREVYVSLRNSDEKTNWIKFHLARAKGQNL